MVKTIEVVKQCAECGWTGQLDRVYRGRTQAGPPQCPDCLANLSFGGRPKNLRLLNPPKALKPGWFAQWLAWFKRSPAKVPLNHPRIYSR